MSQNNRSPQINPCPLLCFPPHPTIDVPFQNTQESQFKDNCKSFPIVASTAGNILHLKAPHMKKISAMRKTWAVQCTSLPAGWQYTGLISYERGCQNKVPEQ